jgi:hypothetical protein
MAAVTKRLGVKVGDWVEIEGRRYELVPQDAGGVALEPRLAVLSSELHQRHGTRPISRGRFDELLGDLPRDEEG